MFSSSQGWDDQKHFKDVFENSQHSGFGPSDWPIWTDFVKENF